MPKFHISSSGSPSRCEAAERACPIGGEHNDFPSAKEAQAWAEEVLAKKYETFVGQEKSSEDRAAKQEKVAVLQASILEKMKEHQRVMNLPRFDESDSHVAWAARERNSFEGARLAHLKELTALDKSGISQEKLIDDALTFSAQAPEQISQTSDEYQKWQAREQAIADFVNIYDADSTKVKEFNSKLTKVKWHYTLWDD